MINTPHQSIGPPPLSISGQIGHFIKWKHAKRRTVLLHEAGYLLLGLVLLATVTGLYFWLDVPLVSAAFTYLVVLVLLSLVSNFYSLIVLSFICVCCLSYFFAPPIYSFRVDYPQDLTTIAAFVITSFIVNFLVTRVRIEQRVIRGLASRCATPTKDWKLPTKRCKKANTSSAKSSIRYQASSGRRSPMVNRPMSVSAFWTTAACDLRIFSMVVGRHSCTRPTFQKPRRLSITQFRPELRTRGCAPSASAADGEYRWHHARGEPLRDREGRIIQWYGLSIDIDERKKAEDRLRRSEGYLAEAQRLSHTGTWVLNPTTMQYLYWSDESYRIWAFDPLQGFPSRDTVWQRIHPDDRDKVWEKVQEALRREKITRASSELYSPMGQSNIWRQLAIMCSPRTESLSK